MLLGRQHLGAGSETEVIVEFRHRPHAEAVIPGAAGQQIPQQPRPKGAINLGATSGQQGGRHGLPDSRQQRMPWRWGMDQTGADLGVLLVGFAQQQQRRLQIEPVLDGAEASSSGVDPEPALGQEHGNAQHIGLHRRQADVEKGLLKSRTVLLSKKGSGGGTIEALVVPSRMLPAPSLHPRGDGLGGIGLIPVLNQAGGRH